MVAQKFIPVLLSIQVLTLENVAHLHFSQALWWWGPSVVNGRWGEKFENFESYS